MLYFLCDPGYLHHRSAPLPLKVDGCSVGAVMGYSEQKTLLLLTNEEEINVFLNVSLTGFRS
jgi:lipid-binding SYLF domain-containing protein